MKNAIILMTALVPTSGHKELIEFALGFPHTRVHVLISGRSFEPVPLASRVRAFQEQFSSEANVVFYGDLDDTAPQNPEDHKDFWQWWRRKILTVTAQEKFDYVVASEPYGLKVAESLQCEFMPYDPGRELNSIKGERARGKPLIYWSEILPAFRRNYCLTATLFGQESVGKTTISKLVAGKLKSKWLFEYARPYLETVGAEVTPEAMEAIHRGQASLQTNAQRAGLTPFLIQDTDLFTTVGYWGIMKQPAPAVLINDAIQLKSDLYYLLQDDAPFVADPLRYGGNKRESDVEHWEKLLKDYELPYTKVPKGTVEAKVDFIVADLQNRFQALWSPIAKFKRE